MEEYTKPKLCTALKVLGYIFLAIPIIALIICTFAIGIGELLIALPVILLVVFIGFTSLWMSEMLKHVSKIEHVSEMNMPLIEQIDSINDETTALKEIMGNYLGYEEQEES